MSDLTVHRFVELERAVWDALVRGDAAADAALLSDDFVGVYPDGFSGREAHAAQLAGGPTMASYEIIDARIMVLAPDTVLLAYRADYRPATAGGAGEPEAMFISSIWCERDARWVNVFSQDTPAATPS